ncbi:ADP-forming succinate--CoA ligase subunit beta [bacterium]|nr:ADP-forming succinate--CoA ligase subunit beta [bacterium]
MKIHEHQAKELLAKSGVAVPAGFVAYSVDEAVQAAKKLEATGCKVFVVKAQIHAGGRGKAGGVKIAKNMDEVKLHAGNILGAVLKTHQTGPDGQEVRRLWIEAANPPKRELYLSLVLDRAKKCVSLLASAEGGMDIEELAEKQPEKILTQPIDPMTGWNAFNSRRLADFFELPKGEADKAGLRKQLDKFVTGIYKMFWEKDCSILEINPLCIVGEGASEQIMPLDCKINFDSNALARHPDILELRDETEEDPSELEASKFDLNFIALDGNIGCMVNGAGLAMATMDIIKHYGGAPANFLDVGGGATTEKVREAFKIILKDPKVKGLFVNIFGGIMRCDVIANGVVQAAKEVDVKVPLVVRLEGTNVELGKQILKDSGLALIAADSMADGAQKIVKAIGA